MKHMLGIAGFCCLGTAMLALAIGRVATAAAPDLEQHIQHIQDGLLPPVLFAGSKSKNLATRMQELHVPGVSIAVIHGGKLEWARGFGAISIGGPPVTDATLFQAASISKPVTTLAVLRLVQAGKLDLDADVNQYLKAWKLPGNEFTEQAKVTLRELLTHSAGVSVHGFRGYAAGEPVPTVIQILNGEPPANNSAIRVDSEPGKTWRYSGGGFVIVQQVVSEVSGVAFPKLMHDQVLDPLGMNHSTYQQPLPAKLLAHAAMPYREDGKPVPGGEPFTYPELGPAGLWTTPSDLARFALGIQTAATGRSSRLLSAASAHDLLVPHIDQQALGLVIGGSTERKYFTHGGANFGYRCILVAYQEGDGAVIMTNSDNGDPLIREILRTIAREYGWPDFAPPVRTIAVIDPKSFDAYVGSYRLPSGDIATFWRDGEHIRSRILGQRALEIFPSSDHEYFPKAVDARWVFSSSAAAADAAATLYQNNRELIAKRADDAEARAALDWSIATETRFRAQTPAAGSETSLRHLIAGLASGKPNYEEMTPKFAEINREQLPMLQAALAQLGPVQSVSFKSVGPAGQDIYQVEFEHESREFKILLGFDGRIHAAEFSP
jgi:CubicO group peptidase (beta-lactamase class C family)